MNCMVDTRMLDPEVRTTALLVAAQECLDTVLSVETVPSPTQLQVVKDVCRDATHALDETAAYLKTTASAQNTRLRYKALRVRCMLRCVSDLYLQDGEEA